MFESYLAPAAGVMLQRAPASAEMWKGPPMSSVAARVFFFDNWRARIDELLDEHAAMGVVELTIDAADALDSDEKDALWLWARGRRDRLVADASERPTIGSTARAESRDRNDMAYPKGAGHD
jgi:hypothetical protein